MFNAYYNITLITNQKQPKLNFIILVKPLSRFLGVIVSYTFVKTNKVY